MARTLYRVVSMKLPFWDGFTAGELFFEFTGHIVEVLLKALVLTFFFRSVSLLRDYRVSFFISIRRSEGRFRDLGLWAGKFGLEFRDFYLRIRGEAILIGGDLELFFEVKTSVSVLGNKLPFRVNLKLGLGEIKRIVIHHIWFVWFAVKNKSGSIGSVVLGGIYVKFHATEVIFLFFFIGYIF